jgi:hypothetical protein
VADHAALLVERHGALLPFARAAVLCAALSGKMLRAGEAENGSANRGKATLGCHKWITVRLAKCW